MAFDFPAAPSPGAIYTPANGPSYQWDGEKWQFYQAPAIYAIQTARSRNRVINPNGRISQELGGTGLTNANGYFCDQWQVQNGIAAFQHVTTQIDGRLRLRGTNTVASLTANDYVMLRQPIEGMMLTDLLWGQAAGLPTVLRFKISATVAGTYSVAIQNGTVSPNPPTRSFTRCFALAANAPTVISVPVPPDLIGTWPIDNTIGLWLVFTVASGTTWITAENVWTAGNFRAGPTISNNIAALNTVDISDVGFHLDPDNIKIAPPFQERGYDDELFCCQRYWWAVSHITSGYNVAGGLVYSNIPLVPQMRIVPVVSVLGPVYGNASAFASNGAVATNVQMKTVITAAGAGWAVGMVNLNARM